MDLQHLIDIGLWPATASARQASAVAAEVRQPHEVGGVNVEGPHEAAPAVLPKGSPLDADPKKLSVLSYNLLAPVFVRPVDLRTGSVQPYAAFGWAEPAAEVLDWSARCPRLVAELRQARADVVCLQEVQFERAAASGTLEMPAWLKQLEGYNARLPSESSLEQMAERNQRVLDADVATGNIVLYRADRLELVCAGSRDANTRVAVCLRGRRGGPLAALDPVAVMSVHLDAGSEEKRVEKLRGCLWLAQQMGVRDLIIAGDMNTECLPGSCLSAFVAGTPVPAEAELLRECASALRVGAEADDTEDGAEEAQAEACEDARQDAPTSIQVAAWERLWHAAAAAPQEHRIELSHVPTGATRAAYDHGKLSGPCSSWRLDHIFYSARSLRLCSAWEALEADPAAVEAGLPNRWCPSDHLPIAAAFEPKAVPRLAEGAAADILERMASLEARQAADREALAAEMDRLEPSPPAEPSEAAQPKKAKKKGERPSEEMVQHIREKRRRLREQKEQQAVERAEFVQKLGVLEQDAVEAHFSLRAWAELGSRQGYGLDVAFVTT